MVVKWVGDCQNSVEDGVSLKWVLKYCAGHIPSWSCSNDEVKAEMTRFHKTTESSRSRWRLFRVSTAFSMIKLE